MQDKVTKDDAKIQYTYYRWAHRAWFADDITTPITSSWLLPQRREVAAEECIMTTHLGVPCIPIQRHVIIDHHIVTKSVNQSWEVAHNQHQNANKSIHHIKAKGRAVHNTVCIE